MLGWLSYFSQRVTNGAPHYLSSPKYSLTFRLLTYTVQLWPIFKKKENISFSVNVWESPLPVCPPNTVCTWFLPAVMLRWSSDNMFSWSDLQLLLCFFIVVENQWVKRKIGEFEKNISEIRAPWTWEPYSFLPSASASKPILAAWNSNQIVGKPWTA